MTYSLIALEYSKTSKLATNDAILKVVSNINMTDRVHEKEELQEAPSYHQARAPTAR